MTGKLSWDTTHVNEGDYSLQIVTQDLYTGLRVAVEVLIRLTENNSPPSFPFLSEPLSLDVAYGMPGSTVNRAVEIAYDGDTYNLDSYKLSAVPDDFAIYINMHNETGEYFNTHTDTNMYE